MADILCLVCNQCPDLDAAPGEGSGSAVNAQTVAAGLQVMATTLTGTASFFSCFGVNLQKWAHNVEQRKPQAERKKLLLCWRWWLGLVTMIGASCGDMAALPFIPLSRVAALGSLTIVANVVICPLFLGEKITRHDILGATLTVVGTSLACIFGVTEEPELDSDCMLMLFNQSFFLTFFFCSLAVLCVMMYLIEGYRRTKKRVLETELGGITNFECLAVWANPKVMLSLTTVIDDRFIFIKKFGPQFYPAILAVFGGISGALSVTLSKTVLIFLRQAIKGDEAGQSVGFMLAFLLPMGVFLFGQIRYLNEALSAYRDSLFVLPVYQCTWILMGIASGLIFYQEYRDLSGLHACIFTLGVILSLIGVQVLTGRKAAAVAGSVARSRRGSTVSITPASGAGEELSSFCVAPANEAEFLGYFAR
eukprot:Hpha_TRINITY_DN16006_c1_g5::TRINITY_DN16006_c1_g5_i5::g.122054::m.122054